MANLIVKDGADATKYIGADGAGTDGDPYIPIRTTKRTSISVYVAIAVTNGAYSIGDAVGGLITFAGAMSAAGKRSMIRSLTLMGISAIEYDMVFLNADLASAHADNAPLGLAIADALKLQGVVPILSTDYTNPGEAFNIATVRNVGLLAQAGAITSLYAYLVAREVTSPGTSTIYMIVDFEFLD